MIGIIYKLTDNTDRVYYGSTTQVITRRLNQHKISNVCTSKIMDKDSMQIECLEQYYFDTDMDYKELLKKREAHYIRNFECINQVIPGRTEKEYRKEYHEKNREQIKERKKEYHQKNREQIKEKKKEWCEKNREQIKEKKKRYFQENKEKITDKRKKEPFTCDCGSVVRKSDKSRHNRTKKHQAYALKDEIADQVLALPEPLV